MVVFFSAGPFLDCAKGKGHKNGSFFFLLAHFWTAQRGRSLRMVSNITELVFTNDKLLMTILVTFFCISEKSFVEIQRGIISFVSLFFVSVCGITFLLLRLPSQL